MIFVLDFLVGLLQGDAEKWREAWPPFVGIAGIGCVAFGILLIARNDLPLGGALILVGLAALMIFVRATQSAEDHRADEFQPEPISVAEIAARARSERDERHSGR